jgi:pimeloyl-ACP methyl ester carboxylesterase
MFGRGTALLVPVFAALALLIAAPTAGAQSGFAQNPVIFVHGFFGSGGQFESQEMRFTSNGYPQSHVTVLEYDSTFATESRQQVMQRLDALVAELKQQTGRAKVDILGHSLGTSVMQEYLNSSPERAANVGRYVNIDGSQADAPPGGVPTLALWAGRGAPGRRIVGAQNVTLPNQTHVESATSPEAFAAFYEFFTGAPPATTDVEPQSGQVQIEGRAVLFPQNRGVTASSVEIWPIDGATGQRTTSAPASTVPVGENGAWGPVAVEAGRHYEMMLVRPGVATLHYYFEPFVRSDHLVRLLYSDAVESALERGEGQAAGLILRYKELWGDQGAQNDVIEVNGENLCNAAVCPIDKRVIGIFVFDRGSDGRSNLAEPDPVFSGLPFLTAVDLFMPAARPPTGTTSFSLRSRGQGPVRTLNVPNFPSTTDGAVVYFNDFDPAASGGGPGATPGKRCVGLRGRPRGRRLGPARIGRSRAKQRRLLRGRTRTTHGRVDRYCVKGGRTLRIGYPTRRFARQSGAARNRALMIVTSSRRVSVAGVRPGITVSQLRKRLRGERRFRTKRNVWFVTRGKGAAHVYRTRRKRLLEVGIADARMTGGVRATKRFLKSW